MSHRETARTNRGPSWDVTLPERRTSVAGFTAFGAVYAVGRDALLNRLAGHSRGINRVAGVVLVVAGVGQLGVALLG